MALRSAGIANHLDDFERLSQRKYRKFQEGSDQPFYGQALVGSTHVIIADLAIAFKTWSDKGLGRTPQDKYNTDSFLTYAELPIAALAAPDALLIQWVFDPFLIDNETGISPYHLVAKAWGFPAYMGKFASYIKMVKDGTRPRMGLGYTTRKVTEQAYVWGRGKRVLSRLNKGISEVFWQEEEDQYGWTAWPYEEQALFIPRQKQHSAKPPEFRQLVDRLYGAPGVNILEMFARNTTIWPGRDAGGNWFFWGDEVENARSVELQGFEQLEIGRQVERETEVAGEESRDEAVEHV